MAENTTDAAEHEPAEPKPETTVVSLSPSEVALFGKVRQLESNVTALCERFIAANESRHELPIHTKVSAALQILSTYCHTLIPIVDHNEEGDMEVFLRPLMPTEEAMLMACHDFVYDLFTTQKKSPAATPIP